MHVLLGMVIAVVILGCATPQNDARRQERTVIRVEMLVFSGRENPQWELTDAEVDELSRRVSDLSSGPPLPEPPGLGYGGFLITTSGHQTGLPETVNVYRGVRIGPVGSGDTRQDDRGLEQWLLNLARQRGYSNLLDSQGL